MLGATQDLGRLATRFAAAALLLAATAAGASALTIELKDVAADRIERQRKAVDGLLPLARTPDVGSLEKRLADAGVKSGAAMMIRVFKASSELEVWLEKDDSFVLFATYPICHWSGSLGPKLREGDKQTPEGFYTITARQMRHIGRWPRAMNLGFPNAFDRANKRDGSYILVHGGCSSVGCFAMTNPVMSEIHGLAKAALRGAQRHIPVHVFPFHMTDAAMAEHAASPWHDFWLTLQAGYRSFERTRRPPRVSVCKGAYRIEDALPKGVKAEEVAGKSRRGTSRLDMMVGAIRTHCPAPVVAKAESQGKAGAATSDHMRTSSHP